VSFFKKNARRGSMQKSPFSKEYRLFLVTLRKAREDADLTHEGLAKQLGYLNEYAFRFNRRDTGNLLFKLILARVSQLAS
jgi:hypothetical protein